MDATYQLRPFLSLRLRAPVEPRLYRILLGDRVAVAGAATMTLWFDRRWRPEDANLSTGVTLHGRHQGIHWRCWTGHNRAGRRLAFFTSPFFRSYLSFHIAVLPLAREALNVAGETLLIGAAFTAGAGATLLLGRGGSGKTRTMLRAIEHGCTPLADEYFSVAASGSAHPLFRVVGLRENIRRQAPRLYRALPTTRKIALAALRASALVTRPPLLLHASWADLGLTPSPQRDGKIARVWWLDEAGPQQTLSADEMARRALAHLVAHDRWYRPGDAALSLAGDPRVHDILTQAFSGAECCTGPAEAVPIDAPAAASALNRVGVSA